MSVTDRAPGDVVTAAMFNTKLEAPIQASEVAAAAITSPKLDTGAVTAAKIARQPCCVVRRTSDQTGIVTATSTVITWETADVNTDNNWVVGTPSRVTINTAGIYLIRAHCWMEASSTGFRQLDIVKNGTTPIGTEFKPTYGASLQTQLTTQALLALAANDYLEAYVYHTQGSNLKLGTAAFESPLMSVYRMCS